MEPWPQFYRVIKQKCFTFYFGQIYRPLLKSKEEDIMFYQKREDYT
jgi:hypothetical protein